MNPEPWLSLSAVILLGLASAARRLAGSAARTGRGRWPWVSPGLQAVAAGLFAAALAVGLAGHAAGTPLTALQVAQSVALAALLLDLALWARYRVDGANPALALLAIVLVGVGLGAGWAAGPALDCAQCRIAAQIENVFFLSGAGGALVMGATGLVLPLRTLAARRGKGHWLPGRAELGSFMQAATTWTLVLLGAGLGVAFWWAWLVLGRLVGDDLRWGWMAAAWLLSLISWLAWRLSRWEGPVAVTFALLAVIAANVGVLAAAPVRHWFGF